MTDSIHANSGMHVNGAPGSLRRSGVSPSPLQPTPTAGTGPAIVDLVIHDIEDTDLAALVPLLRERDARGQATYGCRLRAHNGRDALTDGLEELADSALYLRQDYEESNDERVRDLYMLAVELAAEVLEVHNARR